MNIIKFIDQLRASDRYIETIFSEGSCFQFALLLQAMYGGRVVINVEKDHAALLLNGAVYDIYGENHKDSFIAPTAEDELTMMKWSFGKKAALALDECESCGETIGIV